MRLTFSENPRLLTNLLTELEKVRLLDQGLEPVTIVKGIKIPTTLISKIKLSYKVNYSQTISPIYSIYTIFTITAVPAILTLTLWSEQR